MTDETSSTRGPAENPPLPLIYANAIGLRGGPFDLSLDFGYVRPPAADEPFPATQWAARVAMSWEHARALHRVLGEQIANYESEVGEIPDIEKLRAREGAQ